MRPIVLFAMSMTAWAADGITVEVIEGEGAIQNVRSRGALAPRIRVVDGQGLPVEGAFVTFRLPESGPGARFEDGRIHTASTDARGEAVARGLRLNSLLGPWELRVSAAHGGRLARVAIQQVNAAPVEALTVSKGRPRSLYWLAALATGAAAATTLGVRSGGGIGVRSGGVSAPAAVAAAAPPLSIGIGTGSITAP